jgi:hypothetical protein
MPGVIRNFQRGLKKVVWPQNTLQVPQGYGRMPALDIGNARRVKREYFTYTGQASNIAVNVPILINIPIAKDGDFWISSISGLIENTINGITYAEGTLQITDVMDQYKFYIPSLPWSAVSLDQGFDLFAVAPMGITNNIIEPYCALRGTVLRVELLFTAIQANPPTNTLQITLSGWKEYANAAI